MVRRAEPRYPYIGLGTPLVATCDLWDFYTDEAAKHGYQAGPENFGYMIATVLAQTEEKAQALAEGFVYGGGAVELLERLLNSKRSFGYS